MRDYNHIKDRVEREIEEIMSEKKWTPKHAEALEELLLTLKCVEEMEQMGGGQEGHKKKKKMMKKMMNYNYYEDDEDDEEDEEEMKKRRQRQHQKYERNSYENDNYEHRMRGMGGRRPIPMDYHYLPWPHDDADYMEDWDYGYGPPMNMMPPFRYARGGRGQNQYNQYQYQGNQYEQGMGASQGGSHNGSEQSGSSTQNSGSTTGMSTPPTSTARK